MNRLHKYIVLGPADVMKRLDSQIITDLSPKYVYQYFTESKDLYICTIVFEEYQRQMNSSTSLTCVMEFSNNTLKVELMPTGGRVGFRGNENDLKRPLLELVVNYIFDFTRRFGLAIQEIPVESKDV